MRFLDSHVHMVSRTTDDYQRMAASGVTAIIEPSFWQGQPRTEPGTFKDYFNTLIGFERFRVVGHDRGGRRARAHAARAMVLLRCFVGPIGAGWGSVAIATS